MTTHADGHVQTVDELQRDLATVRMLDAHMPPMILPNSTTLEQEEAAVREYFTRSTMPRELEGYRFNGVLAFNRLMERLKAEPAQFTADEIAWRDVQTGHSDATGVR